MNSLLILVAAALISTAHAQFEAGFVKILEDQRYQDGAAFGNFRNQEDGIKYKEETSPQGIRTGFWEYPDENGEIKRVEFEAGAGIGFRIVSSNLVAPTPIAKKSPPPPRQQQPLPVQRFEPRTAPRPLPQVRAEQPRPQVQALPQPLPQPQHQPQHRLQTVPQAKPNNLVIARQPQPAKPEPVNIFDYPADLQFFRNAGGHSFKFTAV